MISQHNVYIINRNIYIYLSLNPISILKATLMSPTHPFCQVWFFNPRFPPARGHRWRQSLVRLRHQRHRRRNPWRDPGRKRIESNWSPLVQRWSEALPPSPKCQLQRRGVTRGRSWILVFGRFGNMEISSFWDTVLRFVEFAIQGLGHEGWCGKHLWKFVGLGVRWLGLKLEKRPVVFFWKRSWPGYTWITLGLFYLFFTSKTLLWNSSHLFFLEGLVDTNHHFYSKDLSSSKKNRHFQNGGWLALGGTSQLVGS